MLRKLYLSAFCIVLLHWLYSCDQSIEIDYPNDQINTGEVYKDISTAKTALSGIYIQFRDQSIFSGNTVGLGVVMSLYTDELVANVQSGSLTEISDFYDNNLLANNSFVLNIWTTTYKNIYSINAFIEGLSSSNTIDTNLKKPLLGEAYLLRAMYHQYLTQLFGDIPYCITTDYKINTTIGKTSYLQVLQLVEKDLLMAHDLLTYQFRTADRIYPNKSAVDLLLAKNYLLLKQYDNAEYYAKQLLDSNLFSIEQEVSQVFKNTSKGTLWQLSTNAPGQYTLEADTYIFKTFPPVLSLSSDFLSSFYMDDKRKDDWVQEMTQSNLTLAHPYKYKNNQNNYDEYSIVYRIEEVILTLAEAYIYQDKLDLAIDQINQLRQRSNVSLLPYQLSKNEIIDALLQESSNEFFTEHGHRFFDLKRNNKLSVLEQTKPNWSAKNQLLPIPEKELLTNSNLKPQNNGY